MNVNITVTCPKHNMIVNPRYVTEQLEKRMFQMPGGFRFRLQQCLPYPGEPFENKTLQFTNTVPVGRIRDNAQRTPTFKEQRTRFAFNIGDNQVSVSTDPESQ